jgi:uncharacterized protein (DUF362 family)
MSTRVFVDSLKHPGQLVSQIREALEFIRWESLIPPNARVFVKPNLTWKSPLPGVTVTPEFLAAAVEVLKERTSKIIIGESNGGYHSFQAEEAFESHGLYDLAKRFGVDVVNLTRLPAQMVTGTVAGRDLEVELPKLLLEEVDVFVTLPVPKVHSNTTVSLAFKNQWGCLPNPMRLRQHANFAEKINLINRVLKPRIALFDATYMLNKNGPMIGEPVETRLMIASDDIGAGSLACCEIMRINPWSVKHLRLARREGMIPSSLGSVTLNQPVQPFQRERFYVERNLVNWASFAAFHSQFLTTVLYDSRIADWSHRALYRMRRNQTVARVLYGSLGPPEIEGHR